jgi:hypothetical protein
MLLNWSIGEWLVVGFAALAVLLIAYALYTQKRQRSSDSGGGDGSAACGVNSSRQSHEHPDATDASDGGSDGGGDGGGD